MTPEQIALLPPAVQARLLPLLRRQTDLEARQGARTDFYKYCKYIDRGYITGEHLELMAGKLQQVVEGKIKRLILCLPPRHSKSRHASELFPSYYLGHNPEAPVMILSHTLALSKKFGRSVRDYIASPDYHTLFPETQLRRDQTAVGEWGTTRGAQFFAAGVGGAIAGRGARLLCLGPKTPVLGAGRIGDLSCGDSVYSKGGWQRVRSKWLTTHKEYVIINGELIASCNHPLYTTQPTAGWVQAGALRVGDRLQTATLLERVWAKILRLSNPPRNRGVG